ncbi:MAG: GNAT family N-acetyltransferase [Flavobacteriaceae bacterium]|nr:GNAT family N-acetyltransferase [Flavobacteriaceae bacterium]MBT3919233.1 GNAT family N-acetyltransferase [Flavobacteriaceae bacterium]MBT6704432.1 GNAT family N-acetyltransferase [Flavobacteriaceae bacterium]MBT7242568.1 GNAT family N-acetyltransferase [Flavobacteriaceae bacterium]
MFTVKKYTESHKSAWDYFIATAKNATFLFQRDFMDYHKDRFEDFSLLIYKGERLYALLPANINDDVVYSHQGLTYGSFVLQDSAKLKSTFLAFKEVLKFLFEERIKKLDIRIIPSFYNSLPSDELEYILYKAEGSLVKRDVILLIDYQNKLRFQKNRREGINKAKRKGLLVKVDGDYEKFWNEILIPNLKEKYNTSPVHSLDEIKLLAARFPKHIKQVNVYQDDKIVAGTTLFLTKNVVHPQYISGNENKNELGSLDLLMNDVFDHFKEGRNYFSFNTSSEENGKLLNEGLLFWKESYGARPLIFNNYEINTDTYRTLEFKTI